MHPFAPFWMKLAPCARFSSVFRLNSSFKILSRRRSRVQILLDPKKFPIFFISFKKIFLLFPKYFSCPNWCIFVKISNYWQKSAFSTYSVLAPLLAPTVLCNNFENKKFQFDAEFFIKSEKCHCVTVKDVMITKRGKKKIFQDFQVCPNE